MNTALDTLNRMTEALAACQQSVLPQNELIQQWRRAGAQLPLPEKFGDVLSNLLDRMEASALFSEESCSFSQKDLFDSLQMWADKAQARLSNS